MYRFHARFFSKKKIFNFLKINEKRWKSKNIEPTKLDSVVRACDESLLSRDDQFLETLISIWKNGKNDSPPILKQEDTIKLKIGGDGRNVGRKQNHVMMTFCLRKPNHQYCICLYIGHEKYKDLIKIGNLFQYQLSDLQDNGIIDKDNIHWNIELFFPEIGDSCKNRKSAIFLAIKQENYIPDELHLLLRISDTLMECLFSDLIKKKEFSKQIKPAIELAFQNIKIHFDFFQSKSTRKQWNWTSLMDPVSQFIHDTRGKDIEYLWREFYYAQNWVRLFCRPTQGSINNSNQIKGTTMRGGTDGKSVVYNIMSFENRQLYYKINNTPKKIIVRNINSNKENTI
ncbi:hypothetical protein Glove_173g20 [Diversispora epigaea]|uniref:Uncharacterized protein n=1 Tax=Diversispora epigaea TaxID=1348612 RepID=A0A397IP52_9GLOM|nr:hypothetical protein Glove_173g20 [Diversispora epigaea]